MPSSLWQIVPNLTVALWSAAKFEGNHGPLVADSPKQLQGRTDHCS